MIKKMRKYAKQHALQACKDKNKRLHKWKCQTRKNCMTYLLLRSTSLALKYGMSVCTANSFPDSTNEIKIQEAIFELVICVFFFK